MQVEVMGKMDGQGTAGNVLAALASFFFPGLGQLVQGRLLAALLFFVASLVLWVFLLGWLVHIVATIDAARFRPKHYYQES
jgi:TM2 domain-containing membrane protein YozV